MGPAASCHGYQFIDSRAVCAAFTLALGSEAGSRDPEMKRHRVNCRIRSIHSSGDPNERAHPIVNRTSIHRNFWFHLAWFPKTYAGRSVIKALHDFLLCELITYKKINVIERFVNGDLVFKFDDGDT